MRLKFPMRVSLAKTVAFAGALVCVQQFEHTSLSFSLLFFSFTVLSTITFNTVGGFSKPSGSYIFFFAVLTVLFGVTLKAILGEAADSNLETPTLTMATYACTMAMMLLAALLTRRVSAGIPDIGSIFSSARMNMNYSAIGCILIGVILYVVNQANQLESGSLLSGVNQINFFLPLGVILSTIDTITTTNGRRSLSPLNVSSMSFMLVIGMMGFSKQGVFTPFVAWALGAAYARLHIRPAHVIASVTFGVIAFTVLTPLSQIGRDLPGTTLTDRFEENVYLLENLSETRDLFLQSETGNFAPGEHRTYFEVPAGLAERLTMIKVDDSLIAYTARTRPIGYAPILQYFENWIPHVLDPNKSTGGVSYGGNYYAHEIGGILTDSDNSTGISFSAVSEAFHVAGWAGIFLLAPAVLTMLFIVSDVVCGDLRRSPWGLIALLLFAHIAPEGGLGAPIYYTLYINVGIIFAMFLCVYVTPIVGSLFGTSFTRSRARTQPLRPTAASIPH